MTAHFDASASQLDPPDRARLLALIDPRADPADRSAHAGADPLDLAWLLARPDIQPHLEALRALLELRREIQADARRGRAIDILLDVAHKTDDLVEKRLAAAAALRATTTRPPRRPAPERPPPSPTPRGPASSGPAPREPAPQAAHPPESPDPDAIPHAPHRSPPQPRPRHAPAAVGQDHRRNAPPTPLARATQTAQPDRDTHRSRAERPNPAALLALAGVATLPLQPEPVLLTPGRSETQRPPRPAPGASPVSSRKAASARAEPGHTAPRPDAAPTRARPP